MTKSILKTSGTKQKSIKHELLSREKTNNTLRKQIRHSRFERTYELPNNNKNTKKRNDLFQAKSYNGRINNLRRGVPKSNFPIRIGFTLLENEKAVNNFVRQHAMSNVIKEHLLNQVNLPIPKRIQPPKGAREYNIGTIRIGGNGKKWKVIQGKRVKKWVQT